MVVHSTCLSPQEPPQEPPHTVLKCPCEEGGGGREEGGNVETNMHPHFIPSIQAALQEIVFPGSYHHALLRKFPIECNEAHYMLLVAICMYME